MSPRYLDAASSASSTASLRFSMIKPRHDEDTCMYPVRSPLTPHNKQLQIIFMNSCNFCASYSSKRTAIGPKYWLGAFSMSVAGYKRGISRNSQQWRFKSRGLPERRPRIVWTVPENVTTLKLLKHKCLRRQWPPLFIFIDYSLPHNGL